MMTFQNPKGYTREYNDITDGLIFENKEICGGTIHPNTNTLLAALPNHGQVEVKMNKPAYGFRIFAYEGTGYTELTGGYSHYAYRYAGSPSTQYFVQIANQADSTISTADAPTAIRCYTYTDRSETKQSCSKLSGKNIAVIGDSIVQGRYSTDGVTVNAVVQKPWSHLIAEAADTEPANFGIGGASVVNIDWKSLYLNCEKVAGYDVVFVCAGTNDYAFDMDEAAFADAFSHVIERLMANNSEVIVCTPVIRTNRTHANRKGLTLSDFARIATQIAQTNDLQVIDLFALTNTEDFKATLPDGLHPTQAGHHIIAELILKAIMKPSFLLHRAAQRGLFGKCHTFGSSTITDALFVYLDGSPNAESIAAVDSDYRHRPLVCLTSAWKDHIRKTYLHARVFTRTLMAPANHFIMDEILLPEGYVLTLFDRQAFDLHPFGHGENYADFADFRAKGAGAVIWYDGEIVAAASSFLTLDQEIELDVSTLEAHRGKGLASACISLMLRECTQKGLTVHWDAQNDISRHLAEKFGFTAECTYSVYWLPQKED